MVGSTSKWSKINRLGALFLVAGEAERLNVGDAVAATLRNGDDMVQGERDIRLLFATTQAPVVVESFQIKPLLYS